MKDRVYLLSIAELLLDAVPEELSGRCLALMDETRKMRVLMARGHRKQAESIGAGLLLQLAVREALIKQETAAIKDTIRSISLTQLLDILENYGANPLSLEYIYSERGKPYLKNVPFYFNLSHSGEFILCVISEQEVGADIQWRKPQAQERLVERFFSKEEKEMYTVMSEAERHAFFYRMWARKEAYGKLTGEGIAAVIGEDCSDGGLRRNEACKSDCIRKNEIPQLLFEEYVIDDYQIAICKYSTE